MSTSPRLAKAVIAIAGLTCLVWAAIWLLGDTGARSDTVRTVGIFHAFAGVALLVSALDPAKPWLAALGVLAAGAFARLTLSVWGAEAAFAPLAIVAAIAAAPRISGARVVPLLLFLLAFVALLPIGGPQGPASGPGGGPVGP